MPLAVDVDRNSWSGRSTRRGTVRSDVDHDGLISGCGAPAGRSFTEPSLADQSSRHAIGGAVPSYPTFREEDSSPERSLEDTRAACSLGPALTDQPPAAEPRRTPSSRADDAARHRTATRWRIAIAVAVVALLAVGGFLLFGGDAPLIDEPDAPGEFSFEMDGLRASTTSRTPPAQLRDTIREASTGVKATMDELYLRAFVDTDSWGDYEAAFAVFDGPAADRAEGDGDVLTLGADADEVYDALTPTTKTLSITILTDRKDAPTSAIAEVQFQADAQRQDGASTQVSSSGEFFLHPVEGEWKVFAYRVDRDDQASEEPSPTGSPS